MGRIGWRWDPILWASDEGCRLGLRGWWRGEGGGVEGYAGAGGDEARETDGEGGVVAVGFVAGGVRGIWRVEDWRGERTLPCVD